MSQTQVETRTQTVSNNAQTDSEGYHANKYPAEVKFQTLKNLAKSVDEFSVLPYYIIFIVPLLIFAGMYLGGAWHFLALGVAFGVIPVLDLVVPSLKANPTPEQEKILEKQLRYQICTWLWVAVQIPTVLFSCYFYATQPLSLLERVGLVGAVGVMGGLSINVAHELGHKQNKFEKTLAKLSLCFVSYAHFQIEHVHGHHWNVATPKDPATSRFGESFYQFYPRTVIGGYLSAWELEFKRLERLGFDRWSLMSNQMIHFTVAPLVIAGLIGHFFGASAASFFFIQSIVGFSLLEIVNYIEHYGLEREEIAPGRYELVKPIHSWNADERVTNYFLFKLQRHSDHHTYPIRKYQILRSFEESPQLPTGYSGCVLMALVPPLWRYVMDWRVLELRKQVAELRAQAAGKTM